MSYQMTPQELAGMLIEEVKGYCKKRTKDKFSYIECVANNLPDELEDIIEDEKDLQEIWENTDENFRESVRKEYENLWSEHVAIEIGEQLYDLLEAIRISISEDDELTNYEKTYLLEKYENVLEELGNAIAKALDKQEPLSCGKLKEYLLKLYKIAGFTYHGYEDPIEYYISDYYRLNKVGKLELLNMFLDDIGDELDEVEKDLKEYNRLLED